jgi:hypothetical protein
VSSKKPPCPSLLNLFLLLSLLVLVGCEQQESTVQAVAEAGVMDLPVLALSKADYQDRLEGFKKKGPDTIFQVKCIRPHYFNRMVAPFRKRGRIQLSPLNVSGPFI